MLKTILYLRGKTRLKCPLNQKYLLCNSIQHSTQVCRYSLSLSQPVICCFLSLSIRHFICTNAELLRTDGYYRRSPIPAVWSSMFPGVMNSEPEHHHLCLFPKNNPLWELAERSTWVVLNFEVPQTSTFLGSCFVMYKWLYTAGTLGPCASVPDAKVRTSWQNISTWWAENRLNMETLGWKPTKFTDPKCQYSTNLPMRLKIFALFK